MFHIFLFLAFICHYFSIIHRSGAFYFRIYGVTPSPAPASGNSKTASSNKASQNSGAPVPGVLLGLSGGWLVARMFFFGGTLWLIEIIAISVAAGFVFPKGGKVQKRFATAIIAVALLNLFVPGLNPWIRNLRESQLNPPPPTEQSAGQQEQVAPAPIPLEEEIDKRPIFPTTNSPIYLIRSGRYKVKPSKYRLYFSWLGYDTGYVNQWLKIDGLDYKATGREVYELNVTKDEIQVQFINPYQTDPKEDTYLVIRKEPGGQGLHPFLEPVQ